jgi:hypothetical protein
MNLVMSMKAACINPKPPGIFFPLELVTANMKLQPKGMHIGHVI